MSRKKVSKKNQKLIGSVIGLVILIILALFGINNEYVQKVASQYGIELLQENNQVKENTATTNLEVYYIDVGQADSILIKNKDQAMLIDAGNNEDGEDVVKFIQEKGVTKLNYIVGTHPHEDHIGGMDNVINSDIKIENVYMPKIQTNTKTFEDVLDAIANKGLTVTAPNKGDTFALGEANLEVMTESILENKSLNLSSIVLKLEFGNNSFLFMGDAEEENEKTRTWQQVDVLKVRTSWFKHK